jgi:TonB family protein
MSKLASSRERIAQLQPAALVALLFCWASVATGQGTGSIVGTVTAETGLALSGADVGIVGTKLSAVTDDHGGFRLTGVTPGSLEVRARRLGFRPESTHIDVHDGGTSNVDLKLPIVAEDLQPVVVRGKKIEYTGRLAGYYERLEKRSSGTFVTRDQIDKEDPRNLTQLLQRVPGVTLQRLRAGSVGIRMRDRTCLPLVWLDGTALPMGEVDLDGIQPKSLEGIEIYLGSTTAPFQYSWTRNAAACGTVLLWTRGIDTEAPHSTITSPGELEALVASLSVFTADQVDRVAALDSTTPLQIPYPPALYAAHVRGTVLAEFVVDAEGKVEGDTFGVVSSSNPLFTAAVRAMIAKAVFTPALRAGKPVRQLVHQPFEFSGVN